MRIALVSTPFASVPPVGYGGTELVVHELATGLRAAGHEVLVFATGDSPGARSLFRKPVWPPDAENERLHARAAAREIARGRWDVVHAHTPSLLAHADHLGAPLVYTLHHARDEALARVYERAPRVRFVAISARQAALHPELACHVIHHGLDPRRFPPGEGAGGHVAFLGRLSWCKGPDAAVEAARRAGVPILVAGEPHDDDAPEGWREVLAAALRAPHVTRLGAVSGARKLALLADARAFVAPLRWEEPFGLALVEAMLCGTPVVASDIPGGRVPVAKTGMGRLFRAGDPQALADALDEVLRRRPRFVQPRESVETVFSLTRTVDAYEATFAGGDDAALRLEARTA